MTELFDKIRTAIEEVREHSQQQREIRLHPNDLQVIADGLGVKVSELTNEMIFAVLNP